MSNDLKKVRDALEAVTLKCGKAYMNCKEVNAACDAIDALDAMLAKEQPVQYGYDPGTPDGDVPALTFRKGDHVTCILHGEDARVVAAFIKDLAEAQPERESGHHVEQPLEMVWQPIETVPTDTWVIVDQKLFSGRRVAILIDETDKGYGQTWFDDEMDPLEVIPTRWMLLPTDIRRRGRDDR
jgi:hypothetical protein